MLGLNRARRPAAFHTPEGYGQEGYGYDFASDDVQNFAWGFRNQWDNRALGPNGELLDISPYTFADESTTLGLPVAWRCLNMICDGIGILDTLAVRYSAGEGGEAPRRLDPTPVILSDPWPTIEAIVWKVQMVSSMLLHGDAYCLMADIDSDGYPRQLPVLHPERVQVEVVNGRPYYLLNEGDEPLTSREVLHVRGFCLPGAVTGIGVIEALRLALTGALSIDAYGRNTFDESAVPPVTLQVDRPELDRDQAADIQRGGSLHTVTEVERPL